MQLRLADGRAGRRVAQRGGEQGQLQVVDGAGGEGLRLVLRGAGWGWGGGCHGDASQGSRGRVDLGVVCAEGAPQFGPSVLKPHLRKCVMCMCDAPAVQDDSTNQTHFKSVTSPVCLTCRTLLGRPVL